MNRGSLRHLVSLQGPGAPVPDGDGGYTETYAALSPATVYAAIQPATTEALERVMAGTVVATTSHVVTCDYHPGINTETQLLFNGRVLHVTAVRNTDERNRELVLACTERVA